MRAPWLLALLSIALAPAGAADPPAAAAGSEDERIAGAIRTDFILSAEIIVIALGTVAAATFTTQVLTLALVAAVSPEFTAKVQAGKIIQQIAPLVGGKGGGKPDNARGGGKDATKLDEALTKAKALLG